MKMELINNIFMWDNLWIIIIFLFVLLCGLVVVLQVKTIEIQQLRESNFYLNGLILGEEK
jgi:hypothetical protein